ncbi:MAG: hypothetical protein ABGW74_01890 [Campylobacterales bacterium]
MKINHGSIIILFLSLITMLNAEDFTYKIYVDKKEPFIKEVVVLKVDFQQTNPDIVLMFDFKIKKSKNYYFQRIDASESDVYHNTKASYTYLIYPLKAGNLNIEFKLRKKVTTDESVAYSFSGDRDNVKGLVTTDSDIKLASLKLLVKKLPPNTSLVGEFKLDYKIQKHTAYAYEPIHFQVSIDGIGYPPEFKIFPLPKGKYKLFNDKATIKKIIKNNNIKSKTKYPFAISSDKSFTLKKVSIKAFNPKTKTTYFLTIPTQSFDIQEVKTSTLVDKIDNPKHKQNYFKDIIYFLIIFITGFISGHLFKFKNKKIDTDKVNDTTKTKKCKTKKDLYSLILSQTNKENEDKIKKCEKSLYFKKR